MAENQEQTPKKRKMLVVSKNEAGDSMCTGTNTEVTSNGDTTTNGDFMFCAHPTLEEIRQRLAKFADDRNWNQYHTPRNLLLALVGEVGELAEIFQWKDNVREGLPDFSEEEKKHVGQEMSDIIAYLVRMADKCHVDLPAEVLRRTKDKEKTYTKGKVHKV